MRRQKACPEDCGGLGHDREWIEHEGYPVDMTDAEALARGIGGRVDRSFAFERVDEPSLNVGDMVRVDGNGMLRKAVLGEGPIGYVKRIDNMRQYVVVAEYG